jgi:cell wall-associated NlpC family hydrolase
MSLAQRKALWHRSDTETVLGERVRVLALRDGWVKVAVPDQPSQLDPRGYPGWVPARQLTARPPADSTQRVTVTGRTAWLRADDAAAGRRLRVSFGTQLPYIGTVGRWVRVPMPLGGVRRVWSGAVSVHSAGEPALPATRADLVRAATMFKGLPYLWGGLTGFGFDCSGLTWMDYRVHGVVIPRDALPQSRAGTPVRAGQRRKGDLLFYATRGKVHHVTMYIGHGRMLHAPHTGSAVQVTRVATPVYQREYAGARRFLN